MTIRFMAGRSGSGKTTMVLNEIRDRLREQPDGPPIIFLVPDQMTFEMEYELACTPDLNGMIRAQVFSFSRLSLRILQETSGAAKQPITSTGIQMSLRKIIEDEKQHFKVYGKASDKTGFIQHVESMITEFKRYNVNPEALLENIRSIQQQMDEKERVLSGKLEDLHTIYERLEEALDGRYVDAEDTLRMLSERIPDSAYLENAEVYIDGFHHFTPMEMEAVKSLLAKADRVTVTITADKLFDRHLPHELHLFRMTGMTYADFKKMAEELHIETEEPVLLNEYPRFAGSPSLHHLEQNFDARPSKPFRGAADLSISQAASHRAEIEGIARRIHELVRKRGVRFREIAILLRNPSSYHDLIEQVFTDYEVPFFIDQKRSMLHHPLVELIRSALESVTGSFRYEAVFRAVKTDFLFPADADKPLWREEMDILENYVLAYGINGSRWTSGKRWIYRRFRSLEGETAVTDEELNREELINRLKELVAGPLKELADALKKAKTGIQKASALYLFLENLDIPAKLDRMMNEAEIAGRLVEAREHAQVWDAVIVLLDEFAEMMGDRPVSSAQFTDMIDTGLESLKFSLVPPALDQVLIGDMERSRFYALKHTFIAGVNDGVLPARPAEDGILSDEDRELLERNGFAVAPSSRQQLLDENFMIYMAMTSGSEHLHVSYPSADPEGKSLLPSILIGRLEELFPDAVKEWFVNEPESLPEPEQLSFMPNPSVALTYLSSQLQTWKKQYPVHESWWDAYNYLIGHDQSGHAAMVTGSLFYQNQAKPLKPAVTKELYGEHILGSVSRMEQFRSCPFSHFASHGLKLKEREQFRLEAPDVGQLFHSALKMISDRLVETNVSWRDVTKDQCRSLSNEAVNHLAPMLQKEVLMSSNRHQYLKRKLEKIIARAALVISEQAKASLFAPIGLELGFGKGGPLPPMRFKLENGFTMELAGRIDRVDSAESSKGLLLRIVDYKSSDRALNLSEVYYGIALQMLTYLDVIISYSKTWLGVEANPAGVLYFHVHDPMIQTGSALSLEDLEEEVFKKFKMKGLLLGEEEAIQLMDQTLESGSSNIVSAGFKKSGGFSSSSSIASNEEFDMLRRHVRNEFKQIGTEITNGVTDIRPYRMKDRVPCTFCPYKGVCQFDQSLKDNDYRVLKDEKNEQVLKRLKEEAIKNEPSAT
ncbi:helicase-exonuclease AddAB subunit AddB [Bacillus sp. FJAT-42376]|uniref:helicase-exonuclease AddAB subunit AddB n=1 Tax=Bacillus sp. FJAT-42376 TaxID=2014076 RepID=UPI000F509ADA|nr:helicase-exonuclease AddAB subunit AddB [Bacillus sp. FJAT-42376]AZB42275.1 helicase-exonuclease AddAB subunit AddB [Bacillus sp. FJAT-42376]